MVVRFLPGNTRWAIVGLPGLSAFDFVPMTFVPPTVFHSVAPEETHCTLEHLLGLFGFDHVRCEPSEMIYPMTTAVTRTVCPGIENMSRF